MLGQLDLVSARLYNPCTRAHINTGPKWGQFQLLVGESSMLGYGGPFEDGLNPVRHYCIGSIWQWMRPSQWHHHRLALPLLSPVVVVWVYCHRHVRPLPGGSDRGQTHDVDLLRVFRICTRECLQMQDGRDPTAMHIETPSLVFLPRGNSGLLCTISEHIGMSLDHLCDGGSPGGRGPHLLLITNVMFAIVYLVVA